MTRRRALFQLQAVRGQWEAARKQLHMVGELDPSEAVTVAGYGQLLAGMAQRERVFAGDRRPTILGEPPAWAAHQVEALRLAAAGEHEAAARLRDRAFELAPATPGQADGVAFEWLADADTRLGPVLEALVDGNYCWVPFERVRRIEVSEPSSLIDLVLTRADFTWDSGNTASGFVPTTYPAVDGSLGDGSSGDGGPARIEARQRLARRTDWREQPGGAWWGHGQRLFATDAADLPLLQVRTIEFAGGP